MARAEVYERLVRQVPQVRFVVRQVMIRRDHGDQLTSGRAAALDGLRFRTRRQAEERDVDAAPPDPSIRSSLPLEVSVMCTLGCRCSCC